MNMAPLFWTARRHRSYHYIGYINSITTIGISRPSEIVRIPDIVRFWPMYIRISLDRNITLLLPRYYDTTNEDNRTIFLSLTLAAKNK